MLNVAARLVRHSMRNPIFVIFTIIQPLIWLLLFGQLFGGVAELPGLEDGEYTTFLTPGLGIPGLLIALAAGMLLSLGVGGVSNALALVLRNEQAVFSILNFFSLPMTFLSSVLVAKTAMPQWIQYVAAFNPIDWAVSVARYGYYPTLQPSFAAVTLLSLFALVGLLFGWFSVRVYSE